MLSVQTSCKDTGRNKKMSGLDDCRDIGGYKYRVGAWVESPVVVRRRFVLRASVNPFNVEAKVFWPKFKDELKSKTTIFSHNLLYWSKLHKFSKMLTGQ
jgi:hypothetical protein